MPKTSTPAPPGDQLNGLKARRLALGLSQNAVARESQGKLTRDILSRAETGESWPDPLQLQALADIYACPLFTICVESMQVWLQRRGHA